MVTNNGSAEIVNMEAARARRRANELDASEYASAAAHLQAVREGAGLSLADISQRTHIKETYLAAIEEMNLAALPSRPFAIGFVKGYAEFLGLKPGEIVARFKEDAGWSAPVEVEATKFEAASASPEAERPQASLWLVLAVVLFILLCAYQIATTAYEETTPVNLNGASSRESVQTAGPEAVTPIVPRSRRGAEPVLLEQVSPIYPTRCEAGAAAVETVEVAFNVTARGGVAGARVASSTNSCFNPAALNAARRWRFEPVVVEGTPRAAFDLRYTFRFERPV